MFFRLKAVKVAQKEAKGIAQLTVGLGDSLHQVFAGNYIFAEVDRSHPETDNLRPRRFAMSTGSTPLPRLLDMARPCSSSVQPAVAAMRYGAASRVPTAQSREDWNHPRCW